MANYYKLMYITLLFSTINSMEDKKKKNINPIQNAAIGIAAASAEIAIDQPLVYFKNMIQSGKTIDWTKVPSWYRGAGINLTSLGPTTAIQVAVNGILNNQEAQNSPLRQMLNAWCAGAISAIASSPSEMVILHQQITGKNAWKTIQHLRNNFGANCITKGIIPTIMRDGGFACGFLALGPATKEYLKKYSDNPVVGMVGLVGAGLFAAGVTHMFDLVKTIMQNNPSSRQGMIQIMRNIIALEGCKGLFKGFVPRSMRVAMAIPIMSTVTQSLQDYSSKKT